LKLSLRSKEQYGRIIGRRGEDSEVEWEERHFTS